MPFHSLYFHFRFYKEAPSLAKKTVNVKELNCRFSGSSVAEYTHTRTVDQDKIMSLLRVLDNLFGFSIAVGLNTKQIRIVHCGLCLLDRTNFYLIGPGLIMDLTSDPDNQRSHNSEKF